MSNEIDDVDEIVDVPGAAERQEPHLGRPAVKPSHGHEDDEEEGEEQVPEVKRASTAVLAALGVVAVGALGFGGWSLYGIFFPSAGPPAAQPHRVAVSQPGPGQIGQQQRQMQAYPGSPSQPLDPYNQQPGNPQRVFQPQLPPGQQGQSVPQQSFGAAPQMPQPVAAPAQIPPVAPPVQPAAVAEPINPAAPGGIQAVQGVDTTGQGVVPMPDSIPAVGTALSQPGDAARIIGLMPPKIDKILEKQDQGLSQLEQMSKTLDELRERLAALESGQATASQKFDAATAGVMEANHYLMENTKKGRALAKEQTRQASAVDTEKKASISLVAPAPVSTPAEPAPAHQKKVLEKKTETAALTAALPSSSSAIPVTVSPQWVLRQVSPGEGKAWISTRGSREDLREVSLNGDPVPGVGKITAIRQDSSGRWVLDGSTARIEQP